MMLARNPWLDFVRAAAILSVLLGHSLLLLPQPSSLQVMKSGAFMGVEIFFVLSGFLIGGIIWTLCEDFTPASLWHFWLRRWFRTVPNYLLFLALVTVLTVMGVREGAMDGWWKYPLFMQNLFSRQSEFFAEAWSLSVEEVFYFTFPAMALILHRLSRQSPKAVVVVLGLTVVLACTALRLQAAHGSGLEWDADFRKVVLLRLDAIVLGVLTAFGLRRFPFLFAHRLLIWCLLGIFAFCVVYVAIIPWDTLQTSWFSRTWLFSLSSLGCMGLVLYGLRMQFSARFSRACRFFAAISYSAYLSNISVICLILKYSPLSAFLNVIVFWCLTISISWVTFRYWESWFMRLRDRMIALE